MKKTNPNYKEVINNPNPKVDAKNFNKDINIQYKKKIRYYKIAIGVLCALILSLLIPYTVLYLQRIDVYFFDHFSIGIVLLLAGGVAMLLPMATKSRVSGDNKGDNIMIVAAFLCFILAIMTVILSYMSL